MKISCRIIDNENSHQLHPYNTAFLCNEALLHSSRTANRDFSKGCVVPCVIMAKRKLIVVPWYHEGETAFAPCSPATNVACNNNRLQVFSYILSPGCVFPGTAVTPRWCTSWVRWSHGTTPMTLRGARSAVTPCPLACASCTRTTCSCGGSCTPNLCCLCCSRPTGTLLSAAAS